MRDLRLRAIGLTLRAIVAVRLHRLLLPAVRGRGVILALHRVEAVPDPVFAENRGLSLTPDFLDRALRLLARLGYEIVPLDEVPARLRAATAGPPFAVLTFDDGYRDLLTQALPVLERHGAPFTAYLVPGFLDRSATPWWLDLDAALRRLGRIEVPLPEGSFVAPCESDAEKQAAFSGLYWRLRRLPEPELRAAVARLADQARFDAKAALSRLCLDWTEAAALAAHPLASIGAHTLTHPRLATLPPGEARREMAESRARLSERLQVPVKSLAYPVGDPTSAGPREFAQAAEQRFHTAVTTRPGALFAGHAAHLTALPRLSLNGMFQSEPALQALLSGWPFALLNRGRQLNLG